MKDLKRLLYYLCFIPVIILIPLVLLLLFISMLLSMCGFEQWPDIFEEMAYFLSAYTPNLNQNENTI